MHEQMQKDYHSYPEIEAANVYFEAIKSYARHEDVLLNNRVNWCLLFNSFLFTALAVLTAQSGVLVEKFPGILPLLGERSMYSVAVLSIAVTGFVLTFSSALGVVAATMALVKLEQCWRANKGTFFGSELYPDLLGAGSKAADRLGNAYPIFLIVTLLGAWLVVALVAIGTGL